MKEHKIIIYAGTTEGRRMTEYLLTQGIWVHACVATEYGESLLKEHERLTVSHERQNKEQMTELIESIQPECVIDATHPYAQEVTKNIREACDRSSYPVTYLRLLRESISDREQKTKEDGADNPEAVVYVSNVKEAVDYLKNTAGNILVTTGSKELEAYTELPGYKERLFARVLSVKDVVEKCDALGITGKHLICMQGPFSMEMNLATLVDYQIRYLVTKESGTTGGYEEKCEAARRAGAVSVVIGRPSEEAGYHYPELCEYLKKKFGTEKEKNERDKLEISLVGIGTGSERTFTIEARQICEEADLLIGAGRMLQAAEHAIDSQKWGNREKKIALYQEYRADQIVDYIKNHPEYQKVAVVLSGDPGFSSGAKKLKKALLDGRLSSREVLVEVIPGISSVVALSARLGVSWEDAVFASIHGRGANLVSIVRRHKKVFVLAGSAENIRRTGETFSLYGYGDLEVSIGVDLSYEKEEILKLTMKDCVNYQKEALAVMYIENPEAESAVLTVGIPDAAFLRGQVPMTKEEVRTVSLSKMRLKKDSVVYDIGAGTGSVSIEAAQISDEGQVYAIETNKEAVDLIGQNTRKFKTDNVTVVSGMAPEALKELPPPDVVFVGGSKGRLREILDVVVSKNPEARIVLNAITLETVMEALECLKSRKYLEDEIVQIQISKARNIGNYHMMTGQNPVYIISFTLDGRQEQK